MWPVPLPSLDVTFPGLADNLSFDMACLDAAEQNLAAALLRFWEATAFGVVAGRSNVIDQEVNLTACQADNVPVVRRASGGGAVVVGPGCLCFSLILPIPDETPQLGVSGVTRGVMQRLADGLSSSTETVHIQGISDLVLGERKIGGNAQRWKRRAFLHHGTILYDFDLPRIARYLKQPSRQPDYRQGRPHDAFVTNLQWSRESIRQRLSAAWNTKEHT